MFRNKKEKESRLKPWQEKASHRIANLMISTQRGWAAWMDKHVNKLSQKGKLIALALFCLLVGALCIYAGTSRNINARKMSIDPKIKMPISPQVAIGRDSLPPSLRKRIARFHRYLDSLTKSGEGRRTIDSMMLARPGLLDSIRKIEQYYQLPLKDH